MRPLRLEVEGFASFRDRVVIDFNDADLFVLFGPTGAGKSSVIDALTFALYGSVARYDNTRLVEPVVSQGMNEARVRLDFTVGGEAYTAVRVVRRTKSGATTREARLERGGEVHAGNAAELTAAVEKLLGLPFQHFTRCVVLPQGDFAEFLHASAGDRQDLLIRLLDLDVYRRIAQAANQRAADADNRARLLDERLRDELACATDEALAEAQQRVADLDKLLRTLEKGRAELVRLVEARDQAQQAADAAIARAKVLANVRVPEGIADLARQLTESADAQAAAEEVLARAVQEREEAEARRRELPERALLDGVLEKHERLRDLMSRLETAQGRLEEAARAAAHAQSAAGEAERAVAAAQDALQRVRRERAAAHLAEQLRPGEPCPVCQQQVATLPHHDAPAELDDARAAVSDAQAACDAARKAQSAAERTLTMRQTECDHLRRDVDALQAQLDTLPTEADARAQLEQIRLLEEALAAAQRRERDARSAVEKTRARVRKLEADRLAARRDLAAKMRELAQHGLTPGVYEGDDLHEEWRALAQWAERQLAEERAAAETHRQAAEAARREFDARAAEQLAACERADVPVVDQEPRDACADALARARATAEKIAQDLETARALRAEHDALRTRAAVARELGRHLNANNFERWLMNRALGMLVSGASIVLRQLSGGAYSLALDERNDFLVIDHRNADERRIARTLSGGETFLASLALALALAEHVADLSAGGTARLDALFLDEGFGTLDAETLDTVATAIEELGSRGRMVGIVTHVRELAERIPVRFEVSRIGTASTVERVDR